MLFRNLVLTVIVLIFFNVVVLAQSPILTLQYEVEVTLLPDADITTTLYDTGLLHTEADYYSWEADDSTLPSVLIPPNITGCDNIDLGVTYEDEDAAVAGVGGAIFGWLLNKWIDYGIETLVDILASLFGESINGQIPPYDPPSRYFPLSKQFNQKVVDYVLDLFEDWYYGYL